MPTALELAALQTLAALSDPELYLEQMVEAGVCQPLLRLVLSLSPCRARKLSVQILGDVCESKWTRSAVRDAVRAMGKWDELDACVMGEEAAYDAAERECWKELTRNCELRTDLYKPGKPFYDPYSGEFPFVKMLEENWEVIRGEAMHLRNELMVEWPEKYLCERGWDVLAMFAFEKCVT